MRSVIALMSIMSLAALPPLQRSEENPRDVLDRAIDDFLAGRVKESVVGFDRVAARTMALVPRWAVLLAS